jgi:hypothetical protein
VSNNPKGAGSTENKEDIPINDERWNLVLRVLGSREFSRAVKLRNFLEFICRAAITDQVQDIHEQQIGCVVFGRRPDYNPAEDNIVRVEARELRKRLDRHFSSGEGTAEPFRILVPKGTYVPVFEARVDQPSTNKTSEAGVKPSFSAGANGTSLVTSMPTPSRRFRLVYLAMGILIFWVLGMAYWWVGSTRHAPSGSNVIVAAEEDLPRGMLTLLFPRHSEIKLVVSDSSLAAVEILTGRTVPLPQYWSRKYLNDLPPNLKRLAQWPYTSLSDVMVTSKILKALLPSSRVLTMRHPRDLNIRDIEGGNTIFLGSAYSDPWLYEFDSNTNFTIGWDKKGGSLCFGNKDPRPGESGRYCASSGPPRVTFALVAFLPSLQHTGDVLILEGTDGAGTEAAGDFVTDPYHGAHLAQYLRHKPKISPLPYFQILLKAEVLDNAPGRLHVIAVRLIPRP